MLWFQWVGASLLVAGIIARFRVRRPIASAHVPLALRLLGAYLHEYPEERASLHIYGIHHVFVRYDMRARCATLVAVIGILLFLMPLL